MTVVAGVNAWVRFLRHYGPIPTNDNMYDELISRAVRKHKVEPITLPAPYVAELLQNFRGEKPLSYVLTGTAGDGKTYHCRAVWLGLGGSEKDWEGPEKVKRLAVGARQLVVIKDLSELKAEVSASLIAEIAKEVSKTDGARVYLIAANHGQLLEALQKAAQAQSVPRLHVAIEEMLVRGENPDPDVRMVLRDLSRTRVAGLLELVVGAMTAPAAWSHCNVCPVRAAGNICSIWENRARLLGEQDNRLLLRRLSSLIELSERNGVHFPVRHLLALTANAILGHPDAKDGLLSCEDVPDIASAGASERGSIYRNLFGSNLKKRRADRNEVFRKLGAFGIGVETSNAIDGVLVYGPDDPELTGLHRDLVLNDTVYGATRAYVRGQQAYLETADEEVRHAFLEVLQGQRQRLYFTIPEAREDELRLWDLTIFRFGGLYLRALEQLREKKQLDRRVMPLIVRGLNRVFTGMLMQNQDDLVVAVSSSVAQSRRNPLLDEVISVPRKGGEEVAVTGEGRTGMTLKVRLGRDRPLLTFELTPTRFEFLGRVAEGALPSSFSLECQEDLLAFKATLLAGTAERRKEDEEEGHGGAVLRFIELGADGRAFPRRVTVRT
jgi:hypothetical protein